MPSPQPPYWLPPQHLTDPLDIRGVGGEAARREPVAPDNPVTSTGTALEMFVPSPRLPLPLLPQHFASHRPTGHTSGRDLRRPGSRRRHRPPRPARCCRSACRHPALRSGCSPSTSPIHLRSRRTCARAPHDLDRIGDADHFDGHTAARVGAVTEPALSVVSPALHSATRTKGAREVRPGSDLDGIGDADDLDRPEAAHGRAVTEPPCSLFPQHLTAPAATMAHVCSNPAATATAGGSGRRRRRGRSRAGRNTPWPRHPARGPTAAIVSTESPHATLVCPGILRRPLGMGKRPSALVPDPVSAG